MHREQLRTDIINASVMRKAVFDLIPDNATRILDVGCGCGGLLLRLQRDKGCTELFGVDMDADAIPKLGQFIDHAAVVDIEREEILPEEYEGHFNFIIMHDFVEHLFDPWLTLTRVRKFLAEDGVAIISTPNLHYWQLQHEIMSGRFPYGHGLWHGGHIRWYTPASLLTVLSIGGFSVENYCLELPGDVDLTLLARQEPLTTIQFPPMEMQEKYPDKPVYTVQYPQNIRQYYPVYFSTKLIAICTKGNLFWEPQPLTYNCDLLHTLTQAVSNRFDVFNPPPMQCIKPNSFPVESIA